MLYIPICGVFILYTLSTTVYYLLNTTTMNITSMSPTSISAAAGPYGTPILLLSGPQRQRGGGTERSI